MAKKSATFNLEESAWKDIHDFMDKHGVNRNTAIEWMLVERRTMLSTMNRSAIQNEVENRYDLMIQTETRIQI